MYVAYFFDMKFIPIYVLVGIAGPAYLCAMLYNPTFKRFEPQEDEVSEEEEMNAAIRKLDDLDEEKKGE